MLNIIGAVLGIALLIWIVGCLVTKDDKDIDDDDYTDSSY